MNKQEEKIQGGIDGVLYKAIGDDEGVITAEIMSFLHSQLGKYRCPHCGVEYSYQPDYRCCIFCDTYLDYFWAIAPLIKGQVK